MDDPTQKFKDKIKEHKKQDEDSETSVIQSAITAANSGFTFIIAILQLSLIYLAYFLLSSRLGWIYFSIWEFFGIGIGTLSLLTYIRTYIKDIIGNTEKTK
jgi:hypothetical protein